MPNIVFHTCSPAVKTCFIGGKHLEEIQKTKTKGVRKRKTSISSTRINVLIRGVKDVWETACLRERPLTFIHFQSLLLSFSLSPSVLSFQPLGRDQSRPGISVKIWRVFCVTRTARHRQLRWECLIERGEKDKIGGVERNGWKRRASVTQKHSKNQRGIAERLLRRCSGESIKTNK